MMRTSNPTLSNKTFENLDRSFVDGDRMTLQGTVNKTGFLLLLLSIGFYLTWTMIFPEGMQSATEESFAAAKPVAIGGMILGLIFAVVTIFKKQWAGVTAPLYAFAEGIFLGGISALFEYIFPGIVMEAVVLTFGILFALLAAYKSGLIKATENFKLGVSAATGGIFLVYMVSWIGGMFGWQVPLIHGSGMVGIGFSLFIVIIASLNLVLDFDFIENGAERGAPKYMEWYGAFGLLVTLVWLYLEILKLLAKLRGRN